MSERRPCWRCEHEPPLPGRTICALCRATEKREERAARKQAQAPPGPMRAEAGRNGHRRETPPSTAADEKRPGPPLPNGWRGVFLAYLEQHGTYYKAARSAGVSDDTVLRERRRDAAFDRQVEEARQLHADHLEEGMIRQAESHGNPVGYIVRLKALRPAAYIERHAIMSLNVTSELTSEDAAGLLRDMLANLSDSSRELLSAGPTGLAVPSALPEAERPQ